MILNGPESTAAFAAILAGLVRRGDVILLSGPLGVGKSTFARGLIAALGHDGEMPSPTFAIVQPYDALDPPVWHVDLYRIEDRDELVELGLDDAGDAVLLVEWPERAGATVWPDALHLTFDFVPDGARRLTAKVPPSWQSRWPA